MSSELVSALAALVDRLAQLAAEDAVLRTQLREVAKAFLATTENGQPVNQVSPELAVDSASETLAQVVPVEETVHAQSALAEREILPVLTFGSKTASAVEPPKPIRPVSAPPTTEADLPLIEARCRIKAEGSRWAATRQRRLTEGANYGNEIEPKDREIIEKAKSIEGCYLWMNSRNSPIPSDLGQWEDVAGCFEAVANGIALIRIILAERPSSRALLEKAMDLLAEAQSTLRCAVQAIEDDRTDSDQTNIFNWLKLTTAQEQIFIQRYMRADDPADPATWSNIAVRIETLDSRLRNAQQQRKQQESQFRKIRYHLKPIQAGKGTDHDWRTIINAVAEMVDNGLPPSNVELRELLVPVIEEMPDSDDVPVAFQRVLQEIDRFLASRPAEQEARLLQPSAEVREVAGLLNGRSALLIGGLRRPSAKEALESAFGLKELIWFEVREHESSSVFEPYVAQADMAVVLLAIRWSSHSYGEVKKFCEEHGKAFVRLPGGYNPNQVAMQIMEQTRGRL
ncbi:MAG TPA: hypothetical protein VGG64_28460 [Pirellulales bacterium]